MAKHFDTEIRESCDKKYLKVFLKDKNKISEVRNRLVSLRSVRTANITQNSEMDLTVYPAKVYDIHETKQEVEKCLSAFFSGKSLLIGEQVIEETADLLANSPKAKSIYDSALDKYNRGENARNVLDDMRLSLETHLKKILNNDKSLENQLSEVGKYIQEKGLSKELANMFKTLLDYYAKYQNTYVKHNDAVKEKEVDFIIQQTSSFIRMLV